MSEARDRILARLRAQRPAQQPTPSVYRKPLGWDRERRIAEFTARMQAVRGEVHRVARDAWVDWINRNLPARGLRRALVGTGEVGGRFAEGADPGFEIRRYERPVEDWKPARAPVLWPDAAEPRLMSLVPPVHVALLDSTRLFENFAELVEHEHWSAGMPTNALLVSGPSKTADIEQTLAYGIHGPKALITLLLD